jgi:hypothetical protein
MKTKIAALAVAALTLTGTLASSTNQAQAQGRLGLGIGLGIAAGLIGAAAASHVYAGPGYYVTANPRCRFVRQYDAYGYYLGRVRVCRY